VPDDRYFVLTGCAAEQAATQPEKRSGADTSALLTDEISSQNLIVNL